MTIRVDGKNNGDGTYDAYATVSGNPAVIDSAKAASPAEVEALIGRLTKAYCAGGYTIEITQPLFPVFAS